MTNRVLVSHAVDAGAVTLSGLCVIHCVALPALAALLPLAGVWSEVEWVHRAFVIMALPLSGFAVARGAGSPGRAAFVTMALLGMMLLVAAAFLEPLHEVETPVTLIGATLLATAHILRLTRYRPGVRRHV